MDVFSSSFVYFIYSEQPSFSLLSCRFVQIRFVCKNTIIKENIQRRFVWCCHFCAWYAALSVIEWNGIDLEYRATSQSQTFFYFDSSSALFFFLLVIFSRIYFDFLSITINASMYSGQTCAVATRHKVIGTWDCTFLSIPVFSSLFSNRILIASCSRSNRVERCFD